MMTRPANWPGSPATSPPGGACAWPRPQPPDTHTLLLEHLLDTSSQHTEVLGRHEARLQEGDALHRQVRKHMAETDRQLQTLRAKMTKPTEEMGDWEKWIKILGPWLLPLAVLAMTGSIDTALKAAAH